MKELVVNIFQFSEREILNEIAGSQCGVVRDKYKCTTVTSYKGSAYFKHKQYVYVERPNTKREKKKYMDGLTDIQNDQKKRYRRVTHRVRVCASELRYC